VLLNISYIFIPYIYNAISMYNGVLTFTKLHGTGHYLSTQRVLIWSRISILSWNPKIQRRFISHININVFMQICRIFHSTTCQNNVIPIKS